MTRILSPSEEAIHAAFRMNVGPLVNQELSIGEFLRKRRQTVALRHKTWGAFVFHRHVNTFKKVN